MTAATTATSIASRVAGAATGPVTFAVLAVATWPAALASKASETIGMSVPDLGVDKLIGTLLTPVGSADDPGVISISKNLTSTANAIWVGGLICLLLFIVVGCIRLASGSRGAGEKLAAVFGSMILLIAAVGVFQ